MRQSRSGSFFARVGCGYVVAFVLGACSSQQASPQAPPAAEAARRGREPAQAPAATMAEVKARCESVQESAEIPVMCQTDTIDDVPSMVVGFRNLEEASSWLGHFERHIGEPFCAATSHGGHAGRVYMAVGIGEERLGRRFSCELGQWGDWFPLTAHTGAMRQTLREVAAACQGVQEDEELPITCVVDEIAGLPTIIVGFGTRQDAERGLDGMVTEIGEPFCDAANDAGQRALFVVTIANAEARPFDCAGQRWGEWFEIPASTDLSRGELH